MVLFGSMPFDASSIPSLILSLVKADALRWPIAIPYHLTSEPKSRLPLSPRIQRRPVPLRSLRPPTTALHAAQATRPPHYLSTRCSFLRSRHVQTHPWCSLHSQNTTESEMIEGRTWNKPNKNLLAFLAMILQQKQRAQLSVPKVAPLDNLWGFHPVRPLHEQGSQHDARACCQKLARCLPSHQVPFCARLHE
jgi:hypothetical protein